MTMNKEKAIDYVGSIRVFAIWPVLLEGKITSIINGMWIQYSGWFHTIDLSHDPEPLIECNSEEFKKLIKKRIDTLYVTSILFYYLVKLLLIMSPTMKLDQKY